MDRQTAGEIIACLPQERTLFHYYRDRYSIGLLRCLARAPLSVAELKRSPFAPLAQKPKVKEVLAHFGDDLLAEPRLALYDHDPGQTAFTLTLGTWGSEHESRWREKQTSRRGLNLVLHLNFCNLHDQLFRRLGEDGDFFVFWGHPYSPRRNTLAWARIDLDFASGTALIEEIQSDWIRDVVCLAERLRERVKMGVDEDAKTGVWGLECPFRTALAYCRFVLERYLAMWPEAMLWAALSFLRDELGLRRIFYHTPESGRLFKRIDGTMPPRSLYTDLPRRFCFRSTREVPPFLAGQRQATGVLKRHPSTRFQSLELA